MPTADDLTGLGMAYELAALLGNQPANLTATGTTQSTAALALTKNSYINAQTNQTGVIINSTAKIGTPHYFSNGTASATSALIYAPTGHTLNGVASSTPLTLAQNRMCTFFQASLKNWFTETGP
jgi:hypothetical protein